MKAKTGESKNLLTQFLASELKGKYYTSGDIVKISRESLDLTQADLARITGIPSGNISKYESGSRKIGFDIALKLSIALSIHHDSILFPNGIEKDYATILEKIKNRAIKIIEKKEKLAMIA